VSDDVPPQFVQIADRPAAASILTSLETGPDRICLDLEDAFKVAEGYIYKRDGLCHWISLRGECARTYVLE